MKILLPVDGSENSMRATEYIMKKMAGRALVEFELVTVPFQYEKAYLSDAIYDIDGINKDFSLLYKERLVNVQELFKKEGLEVKAQMLSEGEPAKVICEYATAKGFDEITMASRGLSPIKGAVLGSVAYKVLAYSKVPVTLIMPNLTAPGGQQERKLLVTVDGSENSYRAVQYALKIKAEVKDIEIILLAVAFQYDAAYFADNWVGEEMTNRKIVEVTQRALNKAEQLFAGANIPVKSDLLIGEPGNAIISYAEDNDVDRVIMGTRGLNPLREMMLGSITYKVISNTKVPVTLVK